MISFFKRNTTQEKAAEKEKSFAMDDVTQTLLVPFDEPETQKKSPERKETDSTEIVSYTSVGTRQNQQDAVCLEYNEFCTVCVVCDGMGGLSGGERASSLAAQGMAQYLLEHATSEDIPTEMGRAALKLNEKVKSLRDTENRKIEAGTTLTTVFCHDGMVFWCGIGDSHIYLYRNATLEQLNIDHNLGVHLDQMVQDGTITQEEALHHPQRAALTSYLGIAELTLISGNRTPLTLQKDDILVQCTDGLYRCLSDDSICQILEASENLEQGARLLVETALTIPGAHDNTTVALMRFKG